MKDRNSKIILSFFISVMIWFYVDSLVTKAMEFSVDIKYFDLPDDMVIVKKQEVFSYNIIMSKYTYYELKQPPLEIKVSLKDARIGKNYIEPEIIKKFDLPYLSRLYLKEKKVFVEIDKKEVKEIDVSPVIESPEYLLIKDINVNPRKINIEGPSKVLKSIKNIETFPYSIVNPGIYSEIVLLKNPYKNINLSTTSVRLEFKAVGKLFEEKISLPIKIKNLKDEFEVEFLPKSMSAIIKGPIEKFKYIDLSKIYFYIDCKEIVNEGNYQLNLKIDKTDDDFIIEPVGAKTIFITVRRR